MQKLTILKKVRGVMTRFEPLTEEFISAQSEDGLTYSELSAVLSSYGLDIRKVVHDPTRQIFNTYYADYDQGKYAAIFLQRQYIQDTGQAELRALTKYGGICPELAAGEWKSFYLKCVPMVMLIYDLSLIHISNTASDSAADHKRIFFEAISRFSHSNKRKMRGIRI